MRVAGRHGPVLGPGSDVAWVEVTTAGADDEAGDEAGGPAVAVARVPDGPPYVLRGSAARVWAAATEPGTATEVVERVALATGLDAAAVGADVRGLLDELLDRGLLVLVDSAVQSAKISSRYSP